MVVFPPCKINLGLYIHARREDGYHNIETCFYPVPFTDVLEAVPSNSFSFQATGLSLPGLPNDNLCTRAFMLMKKVYNVPPVAIFLHKCIPPGAGLGGGSSDAAWTLRILNDLFGLKQSKTELAALAAQLGSDCAFFIYDQPMLGSGRGEKLRTVDVSLRGKFLALLKPDVHVGTAEAYQWITPRKPPHPLEDILRLQPDDWRHRLINDFEQSVSRRYPVIAEIKNMLYEAGARYASMTGSGSAVFGIFDQPVQLPDSLVPYCIWSGDLL
jgi:4-diphosphocytidyl-2-C-methyl-D-erythritol kinase